jgi:hypothetical protein
VDAAGAEGDVAYLWPCNVQTWRHWQALQTQWRIGMGGATGLDYSGVRAYLDEQDIKKAERREIFEGIQAAERGTLDAWAEQAERERNQKQG